MFWGPLSNLPPELGRSLFAGPRANLQSLPLGRPVQVVETWPLVLGAGSLGWEWGHWDPIISKS